VISQPRVAGIGEILWDRFPDGDRLGGAPANFAFHAGQLGADAQIVSRIGNDPDGEQLARLLSTRGLSDAFIQRTDLHATGIVRVEINAGQPTYIIEQPAAWDFIEMSDELKALASELDAVCFGTLAQRNPVSRQAIQQFVQLCPKKTTRLFDINLRQAFYDAEVIEFGLDHATLLKLNGEELEVLSKLFQWTSSEHAIKEIFARYPIELIAVTLGEKGCEIVTREGKVRAAAPKITCVDAVGAGDAFSAALVTGLLADLPLEKVAEKANRTGAFVASQPGAMAPLPQEYRIL
jgi:fructokinase